MDVNTHEDTMRIAYKLIQLSFWRMPSNQFIPLLKSVDDSRLVLDNILKCLFRKFDGLTVLDPLCADILTFIETIISEKEYSEVLFNLSWAPL